MEDQKVRKPNGPTGLPEAAPSCCTYTTILVYTVTLRIKPLRKLAGFQRETDPRSHERGTQALLALHAGSVA